MTSEVNGLSWKGDILSLPEFPVPLSVKGAKGFACKEIQKIFDSPESQRRPDILRWLTRVMSQVHTLNAETVHDLEGRIQEFALSIFPAPSSDGLAYKKAFSDAILARYGVKVSMQVGKDTGFEDLF